MKVMSTNALHSPLKLLEIEALFQRTTNSKWPTGNQVLIVPELTQGADRQFSGSRDPERSNS